MASFLLVNGSAMILLLSLLSWNCQHVLSYVSEDVDLSTIKEDHALAVLELQFQDAKVLTQKIRQRHKRV